MKADGTGATEKARKMAAKLLAVIREDSAAGRKTLVVLGSGCSVVRGLPTMTQIFTWLDEALKQRLEIAKWKALKEQHVVKSLRDDLETMRNGGGSRSVAARALRLLQTAPLESRLSYGQNADHRRLEDMCAELWNDFGRVFLVGGISAPGGDQTLVVMREPTAFHNLVARLVKQDVAIPLSLNFDGFTRKAINKEIDDKNRYCLIVNDPSQLREFLCAGTGNSRMMPFVVKVWGDVFHAVCHNPFCAHFETPIPLHAINPLVEHAGREDGAPMSGAGRGSDGEEKLFPQNARQPGYSELIRCPECEQERQLRVYFAGYQEKEQKTGELIEVLEGYVAPRIGNLLIAGFSGDWDTKLVDFLVKLGRRCTEQALSERPRVFCLAPNVTHIQQRLGTAGIDVIHVEGLHADAFAEQWDEHSGGRMPTADTSEVGVQLKEEWHFWQKLLPEPDDEHRTKLPRWCQDFPNQALQDTLGLVRQLGIKTALLRSSWEHTRLRHSVGCATLIWRWHEDFYRRNHQGSPPTLYPRSIVMLAAALHDMGHPPFSHLTEEVLSELRWTLPGAEHFQHDTAPFNAASERVTEEARRLVGIAFGSSSLPGDASEKIITRLIEGRSGVPVLDAMLNSPLDVDKIDYVFRDCQMLGQAVHLPAAQGEEEKRKAWFETFIEHQILLPSGLIGLHGLGAEKARELLEERWYLYRNVYFRPSFRAVERIARAMLTLWLLYRVPEKRHLPKGKIEQPISPQSENGLIARTLLWERLTNVKADRGGEAGLTERILNELIGKECEQSAIKPALSPNVKEWVEACRCVLDALLRKPKADNILMDQFEKQLFNAATVSQPLYVSAAQYRERVREIVRSLEYDRPCLALIDAAVMPRMLSYAGSGPAAECYVVPHSDPDHWGRTPPPRWTPLSESAFAERDKKRHVQLLVLSPYPDDYNTVRHVEDRLRAECKRYGIEPLERMPAP